MNIAPDGSDPVPADTAPLADGMPQPDTPPPALHLYVEAKIDGRSNLIVQGTSVTWHHFQFAAPGRELFINEPTLLDMVAWQPVWPDIPDAENRDCNCMSSTYTELPTALPAVPSTVTITHVKGRRDTTPSAIELPSAENQFRLVLELNDVGISGSDFYGAMIDVVPVPTQ